MQFFFFLLGAIATALFILNNIVRTALRRKKISFWEMTNAFFVALLPAIALILDNLANPAFDTLEQANFLIIIPLMISHLGLTVVEGFRPQGLRYSRGILGLGLGFLLLIATATYSFISVQAELASLDRDIIPTPVNSNESRDPCTVAGEAFIRNVILDLAEATGMEAEVVLFEIGVDRSVSIGERVTANGGDVELFIQGMTQLIVDSVRDLLSRGCIEQAPASAILIAAPSFIRQSIINDFESSANPLLQFLDDFNNQLESSDIPAPAQTATIRAFQEFLAQRPTATATITLTFTPSSTPTPTITRTPRATDSPTPTRIRFTTATPTLTATLPNPCLATSLYNVNLRDYPALEESRVLATIPFDTVLTVYAPNPDKTWWYTDYNGTVGWLSGEFIRLTPACNNLPPRRP